MMRTKLHFGFKVSAPITLRFYKVSQSWLAESPRNNFRWDFHARFYHLLSFKPNLLPSSINFILCLYFESRALLLTNLVAKHFAKRWIIADIERKCRKNISNLLDLTNWQHKSNQRMSAIIEETSRNLSLRHCLENLKLGMRCWYLWSQNYTSESPLLAQK